MQPPPSSRSRSKGSERREPDVAANSAAPPPLLISVVVVAHGRRKYLAEALRSLLDQTLPRHEFEIFVLKDFPAPELVDEFDRLAPTIVDFAPGPLGGWVHAVKDRLRGELVAFLDDDDTFAPDKLERVVSAFRDSPAALYFHHSILALDGAGAGRKSLDTDTAGPPLIRTFGPDASRRSFPALWAEDAAFNESSIAVRHRVLDAFPGELAGIQVSLSAFLFFASLRLNGTLLIDRAPLGRYRREEGFGPRGTPSPRSAHRLGELAGPRGKDAAVLLVLIRPLRLARAEAPLRAAISRAAIVAALEGATMSRAQLIRELWVSCRHRAPSALVAERIVLLDALRFLAAPERGRGAWRRHRTPLATVSTE
jgi:glycosyltransferase involved in cell wall biosynthesis